jgi:3-oxoacyl-[acyl-carrier-protein] synthase-3
MFKSRIAGTGRAVPDKVVTNDDLSKLVATNDEWIQARTGIRERRVLEEGRVTSDLAAEAGRRACATAELDPAELDCIICCTVTPDMPLPAVAVTVQQKLGASCAAFDMAAACAGFIYGLSVGDALIKSGTMKRVLVIGVEVLTRVLDWTDRNTCVLFGDGAGAVVLVPSSDERGVLSTHLFADGSTAHLLNIPAGGTAEPASTKSIEARHHFVKMQGKPVFTHAVKNISRASQIALEANGLTVEDIDWVVAHQANLRILEGVAERVGIPLSKFYLNIHKYGNTSSASIPIALDEAVREGKIKTGELLLFSALGAGLSWGSAVVRF